MVGIKLGITLNYLSSSFYQLRREKKSSPKKVDFSGEYLLLVKDEVYNQTKNVD